MTSCLLRPRPSFACECVLLVVLWGRIVFEEGNCQMWLRKLLSSIWRVSVRMSINSAD